MGQQEVLNLLKEYRKQSDNWFTIRQIKNGLIEGGSSKNYTNGVPGDLLKLASFNFVQVRGIGAWRHHKEFRAYKR